MSVWRLLSASPCSTATWWPSSSRSSHLESSVPVTLIQVHPNPALMELIAVKFLDFFFKKFLPRKNYVYMVGQKTWLDCCPPGLGLKPCWITNFLLHAWSKSTPRKQQWSLIRLRTLSYLYQTRVGYFMSFLLCGSTWLCFGFLFSWSWCLLSYLETFSPTSQAVISQCRGKQILEWSELPDEIPFVLLIYVNCICLFVFI